MKEDIIISKEALSQTRFEVALVNDLSHVKANVFIQMGNKRVNAKSIIGIISLELKAGNIVTVSVVGEDEEEAMKKVKQILY